MEASAIPASVGLARSRIAFRAPLLRIRTDDQLVTLFREGNDEAFRVIHDRYRSRMLAYTRQMLGSSGRDPEDAVQDIFMRAYHGLRASRRQLALRAWLYRIAHNRCIDDLRRPQPLAIDAGDQPSGGFQDPVAKVEQRDALRRLISDVQQLPGQQRSALLMRELSGMSYSEVSGALGVTVPAVKSLLVRARVGLAQASEARNTACSEIRADLILAHDRGVRTSGLARRHLRECQGCREFRTEVRGVSRQLAALTPALGPLGLMAKLLGLGGGGGGAAAGGSAVAAGGSSAAATAGGSVAAGSAGLLVGGAGHVATLLAAAVVTAGGAVEIQSTLSTAATHHSHPQARVATASPWPGAGSGVAAPDGTPVIPGVTAITGSAAGTSQPPGAPTLTGSGTGGPATAPGFARRTPISELLDPGIYPPQSLSPPSASSTPSDPNAAGSTSPGPATSPDGAGTTTPTASGTSDANTSGSAVAPGASSATTPGSVPSEASSTDGSGSNTTASESSTPGATASASASTAGSSGASSTASTGSGSTAVGRNTTAAGTGSVVSFIQHRRTRRRHRLDTLIPR